MSLLPSRFLIRVFLLSLTLASLITTGVLAQAPDAGDLPDSPLFNGFEATGQSAGFPTIDGGAPALPFSQALLTYVNNLTFLLGAFFLIRVIWGGWLWLTARGNEQQVTKAQHMIFHAIVGKAIVIGARLIAELALLIIGQATLGDPGS